MDYLGNNHWILISKLIEKFIFGDQILLSTERKGRQLLWILLGNLWKTRTSIVSVVVGALSSVSKQLKCHLEQIVIPDNKRTLQKTAHLGLAHILRKVLDF